MKAILLHLRLGLSGGEEVHGSGWIFLDTFQLNILNISTSGKIFKKNHDADYQPQLCLDSLKSNGKIRPAAF